MSRYNKRRASGTIDKLDPNLKDTVDQMLISCQSYKSVCEYLAQNGCQLSQQSVSRYAKRFLSNLQELQIARQNFEMIATQMDKYPNLDPSEPILMTMCQKIFDAVSKLDEEKFDSVKPDKLIREATALIRAAAQKKKTDNDIKNDKIIALEENQALLYENIKKSNPKLYDELLVEIQKLKQKESNQGG